MELLYFILGIIFVTYIIPICDGLSAWFLTWIEAKKVKSTEIVNLTNIKMRQAATSADETPPSMKLIGFSREDDYEEEDDEE